jgi:adenylyltransferase/sulfurtransferase
VDERYARQIEVPGIGVEGQARLAAARIVVLGAGGLGFPVLTYLGAAGVGRITFIDHDVVSPSNLNRQCLFTPGDIGRRKTEVALERLRVLNPTVSWSGLAETITPGSARRALAGADVALDCADNHGARAVLAEAARHAAVPLVHGAVAGFEGQVAVLPPSGRPCFACLYPEAPAEGDPPPVLGAVAGAVGSLMAIEAIRHVVGIGPCRAGFLLVTDLERGIFDWLRIPARDSCSWCGRP